MGEDNSSLKPDLKSWYILIFSPPPKKYLESPSRRVGGQEKFIGVLPTDLRHLYAKTKHLEAIAKQIFKARKKLKEPLGSLQFPYYKALLKLIQYLHQVIRVYLSIQIKQSIGKKQQTIFTAFEIRQNWKIVVSKSIKKSIAATEAKEDVITISFEEALSIMHDPALSQYFTPKTPS